MYIFHSTFRALQSRTHHETGFRHKGNLDRYIRSIYKKGAREEREKANEERQLQAINAVSSIIAYTLCHKLVFIFVWRLQSLLVSLLTFMGFI